MSATSPQHPEWRRRYEQARDETIPWIEAHVPLAGLAVLEYGCGQGAVSCALATSCERHIGVDIDAGEIALAREHLARHGATNSELHARDAGTIVSHVATYAGQVDVFLLYAVLEHMTLDERLGVLRMAREVVRDDGHIVICESPNRLVAFDHHTGQMPFLHALPTDLAARYCRRSQRAELVESIDSAHAAGGAQAAVQALTRWGTGLSFHELELVFDDLPAHTLASNYHPLLYAGRPVRWEEVQLAATLEAWRPDLPPCWSRSWLDTILSAHPLPAPPAHVRPWQPRLEHDVPGVAMLANGLLELRPGARLPVSLPAAVDEIHVGLLCAHGAEQALRVHTPTGEELAPRAVASLYGIPTWHASTRLARPAQSVELSLPDGGCVSFVGHPGPPDPLVAAGRARG